MVIKSLDLFTGVGMIAHALRGLGIEPAAYCEQDAMAIAVLRQRMRTGDLPAAPIHTDVAKFPGKDFRGKVQLIAGGFPCFPAGTPVLTDRGYMPIETVTGEEKLLTHTGSWKPIENLQRKLFPGRIASVSLKRHFQPIQCTDNHPFYARTLVNTEPDWVPARNLTTSHYVGLPINTKSLVPTFDVPHNTGARFGGKQCDETKTLHLSDPDQWYMMGVFLGDGWNQDSRKPSGQLQYRITFVVNHTQEAEIIPRLSKVLNLCRGDVNANCTKYIATNKMWWTILNEFGRYAHGKMIPEWVHAAPTHLVEKFVEGYMASDGYKRYTSKQSVEWKMSTVSQDLALGIQRLIAKLGNCFGVSKYERPPTCVIEGRTVNQRPSFEISGRVPLLRANTCSFIDNGYVWYAVTDVTFSQVDDPIWVYNFQVEDDHSYVVQNVVVKNCTGFSSVGGREGFDNPGSGLYKHIIRLVTEIQPNIVFLENVAAIRLDGLRHVAETLRSRGYDVSWISLRGFHVGAPQHRPRWFCLATKNGFSGTLGLTEPFKKYNWTKEPCARMVLDKTMTNERHALLGNSVIPDLVRWAFLYLWTGSCWPAAKVLSSKEWTFKKPDISKTIPSKDPKEPPAIGMATAKNQVAGIVAPKGLLDLPKSRQIILDPKKFTFTGPRNPNNTLEPHAAPVTVTTWATPRHGNTQPSRVLTLRCQRDLPTQIRFAACTPEHLRSGNPNPEFVEWLMGVPLGWTDPFGAVKKKQP